MDNEGMKISAKADYAVQALCQIALSSRDLEKVSVERIAHKHEMPEKFLQGILTTLRKAGYIESSRGPSGGYVLSKSPDKISVADIIRAVDGPLAAVRNHAPEELKYDSTLKHLPDVWIATRAALREVLENVTIEQIIYGKFDSKIKKSISSKDARKRR
jgi:Rrf2 family protein